ESVERFLGFARLAVDMLGGECACWIPIWEPAHAATRAYREGVWPPGLRDIRAARRALDHMARAHRECHALIKDRIPGAQVGAAVRPRLYVPADPGSAWDARRVFHEESVALRDFLDRVDPEAFDFLAFALPEAETLRWSLTRWSAGWTDWLPAAVELPEAERETLWLEIAEALASYGRELWLTGVGARHGDERARCRHLAESARFAQRLVGEGLPVTGIFHRSLLDA